MTEPPIEPGDVSEGRLPLDPPSEPAGPWIGVLATPQRVEAQLIAATQEEISRAALMEQLNQSFGLITPEMAAVDGGVKEILFGESTSDGAIAAPPYVIGKTEFVSPLAD